MSQDQLVGEMKLFEQRQLQLGVILIVLCIALFFMFRGGHQFAITWVIAIQVGLLVELSSLRRMIRLLRMLAGDESSGSA